MIALRLKMPAQQIKFNPLQSRFLTASATTGAGIRRPDSTSSGQHRTFLENAINWKPIIDKYMKLKEQQSSHVSEVLYGETLEDLHWQPVVSPVPDQAKF